MSSERTMFNVVNERTLMVKYFSFVPVADTKEVYFLGITLQK